MAPKLELPSAALMVGLLFFSLIPPAEAYDAGDGLALLLCTVLTVVGFCACLAHLFRPRPSKDEARPVRACRQPELDLPRPRCQRASGS
uniref:Uncharacterized protein n=1 Tax=Pundamilia nyererei TaxID=303518 RepID=A0A3B4FL28_9CICH